MTDTYPQVDIDDLDADFEDDDQETPDYDDTFENLDPESAAFLDQLVLKTILFCEELSDLELRPYQRAFAYRFIESVILHDANTITALFSRQSGKSECVAVVVAGIVVLFPKLAEQIEMLSDFKKGVWVGVFAPVDGQSDFVFGRIKDKLTSDRAKAFMDDPEIKEKVDAKSKLITLASGSLIRRQTANTKAKIEGATYHIALIDEAQDTDNTVVAKSISPMLASTAGTTVKIGTPSFTKGHFYDDIRMNRQRATMRGVKQNHFQADYKLVQKYNPRYATYIKNEKIKWGEDSDEFLMSYALKWMLDRGMLIGEDELAYLADPHMELVRAWTRTPVVVGIDPARVKDSTVVTVCWVDWDHPDAAGYREHRILNWLEIADTSYEEQYFKIMDFLAPYDVAFIGVDAQGMGGPIAERLQLMVGHRTTVVPLSSDAKTQHERWTHLMQLLQRQMVIYPGHYKARRTRAWKRFKQQMEDAEKVIRGQFMLVQAPDEARNANDDYVDSLALACAMSMEETVAEVEVMDAPWFRQ